ncbi:nucleolar complex protein 4 [Aulographum hederae CBS 113979]|uniref:Nucleolar complex protein 4 n=1 Tax=Aulographum hederae CBS 113979 TaxID=1176131 RepID=A0A6G1H9E1_9PEZI|nr:nucleolar complex protein 4 [Aulographum hederae CBS 113979]
MEPSNKKRKRVQNDAEYISRKDEKKRIKLLESQISESRKHYNNIPEITSLAKEGHPETAKLAMESLCGVFSRLMSDGSMTSQKGVPREEQLIVEWLRKQYDEYIRLLLSRLRKTDETILLNFTMHLIRQEASASKTDDVWTSTSRPFFNLVRELLVSEIDAVREAFMKKYIEKYDNVRYYTFGSISSLLTGQSSMDIEEQAVSNCLKILSSAEGPPATKDDLEFFGDAPTDKKDKLYSSAAHRRRAQDVWLALLRVGLNKTQRKAILRIMTERIVPQFNKPELLMDFLTDSYNVEGETALLALSGLFYLIREKNLDYPSFYPKLYQLLDTGLLHSKQRSRFFRLLETFLSSTHLPAALVASFIKRLARLALHGPPAGIVVVIPYIYNMLKEHPTCTFMIHREVRHSDDRKELEEEGMEDPFDMDEEDPMNTWAIDSSLWELEALQSHYHPNVATLAKIISEQFTKQAYNIEDFLDHSYNGLIEGELTRNVKKTPVVEYQIPENVFEGQIGLLLPKALEIS